MSQPPPLPQQPPPPRKSLFTVRRVIGVIVVLVVVRGCFWSGGSNETNTIVGKWVDERATLEFTDGGKVILTKDSSSKPTFGSYRLDGTRLFVEGDRLGFYTVEFRSANELLVVAEYEERELEGRWTKEGATQPSPSMPNAGRMTAIQSQITDLQRRRASLQELIDKALAEKTELVAQLKQAGVNTSSDLKTNPAARQIAQNLVRLTGEIQSLQRDAMRLDEAIGKAESLVRRIEQSQVAVSSDEFASLTGELLTAAETHDGSAANAPLDPLSLEAMLDESLTSTPPVDSASGKAGQLVGKWKIVEGEQDGTVQFTAGGTVIFSWFHPSLKRDWVETGSYSVKKNNLEIKAAGEYGSQSSRRMEFLSPDELLINKPSGHDFTWLFGRLRRIQDAH